VETRRTGGSEGDAEGGTNGEGIVSVVLPTDRWTDACDQLATQVRDRREATADDCEFVVACDRPDDPVVGDAAGTVAEVVVAGEPQGCSAKCNALAAGLERASGERVVCTDADFDHEPGWLAAVLEHLADAPAGHVVSTAPVLVSEGALVRLLEGPGGIGAALTTLLDTTAWGGTMAFRRGEVDVETYVSDLRRTVSDDALLTQQVDGIESIGALVREVPVSGSISETLDRQVRWVRTGLYFDPAGLAFGVLLSILVLVGTLLAPLVTVPLVTAVAGLAYVYCGIRRWTFLLTVPAYAASLPLLIYGLARVEFDWNGRRYRWTGPFDVSVVDRDAD
jgi:hypothetical protein